MATQLTKIIEEFQRWYASDVHSGRIDYYKGRITKEYLKSLSESEFKDFFVQFVSEGGKVQSGGHRGIGKFRKMLDNDFSNFRFFILEPFETVFNLKNWFKNIDKFNGFGVGIATIYLNRIDKTIYPIMNNKTTNALQKLNFKIPSTKNFNNYELVRSIQIKLIRSFPILENYYKVDALNHFILTKGQWLINEITGEIPTELTKEQFVEILFDKDITMPENIFDFQSIYSFPNHQAPANRVVRKNSERTYLLVHKKEGPYPVGPINSRIGYLGKRIAKKYPIVLNVRENAKYKYWDIFFNGWSEGNFFVWQLKSNLVKALEETGLVGDFQSADEIPEALTNKFNEGAKRTIIVNAYERSREAREKCIEHYGTICCVCSFDFQKIYGEIGNGFIHVHHLIPVSEIGENYKIDPIKDLRPVCPNCHSMLHKSKDTLEIDELKKILISVSLKLGH